MKSLFVVLGNQLFDTKYIRDFKNSTFFMCEDYELCTYQRQVNYIKKNFPIIDFNAGHDLNLGIQTKGKHYLAKEWNMNNTVNISFVEL